MSASVTPVSTPAASVPSLTAILARLHEAQVERRAAIASVREISDGLDRKERGDEDSAQYTGQTLREAMRRVARAELTIETVKVDADARKAAIHADRTARGH